MLRASRAPRRALIGGLVLASAILGACGAGASSLPSIAIPSDLGSMTLPTIDASGALSGCLDATTVGILNQLESQAPDVGGALTANKDALVSGLQAFQPADTATTTWRDQLVTALQSGDLATATTKIQMLVSGEVSIPTC
jgi:hypothetical protein